MLNRIDWHICAVISFYAVATDFPTVNWTAQANCMILLCHCNLLVLRLFEKSSKEEKASSSDLFMMLIFNEVSFSCQKDFSLQCIFYFQVEYFLHLCPLAKKEYIKNKIFRSLVFKQNPWECKQISHPYNPMQNFKDSYAFCCYAFQ